VARRHLAQRGVIEQATLLDRRIAMIGM